MNDEALEAFVEVARGKTVEQIARAMTGIGPDEEMAARFYDGSLNRGVEMSLRAARILAIEECAREARSWGDIITARQILKLKEKTMRCEQCGLTHTPHPRFLAPRASAGTALTARTCRARGRTSLEDQFQIGTYLPEKKQ